MSYFPFPHSRKAGYSGITGGAGREGLRMGTIGTTTPGANLWDGGGRGGKQLLLAATCLHWQPEVTASTFHWAPGCIATLVVGPAILLHF